MWSTTRTSTGALSGNSFNPSCSCIAVNSDAPNPGGASPLVLPAPLSGANSRWTSNNPARPVLSTTLRSRSSLESVTPANRAIVTPQASTVLFGPLLPYDARPQRLTGGRSVGDRGDMWFRSTGVQLSGLVGCIFKPPLAIVRLYTGSSL